VWAFCITDKAASDEVKAAFENSATRAWPGRIPRAGRLRNWCEIQKLLKGNKHATRNSVCKWASVRKTPRRWYSGHHQLYLLGNRRARDVSALGRFAQQRKLAGSERENRYQQQEMK
jgi:hypothetical protein